MVNSSFFLAMVNACQELVQLIQNQGRKWQKALHFERDARMRMERMCEQVASQSAKLEKQMQRASRIEQKSLAGGRAALAARKSLDLRAANESSTLSDEDEFYDAIDDPQTIGVFRIPYVVSRGGWYPWWCFLSLRLQQHLSVNDKQSPNIVADDVSSCDGNESELEEQEDDKLPMVIVRSTCRSF